MKTDIRSLSPESVGDKPDANAGTVIAQIRDLAATLLNVGVSELDVHADLREAGMDAFLFSELVAGLSRKWDREITGSALQDFPTLASLAAHFQAGQPELVPAPAPASGRPEPDLLAKTLSFLQSQVSMVTKLGASKIDVDAPLENYGLDSVMVLQMTAQLEERLGPLPKTLFFEYRNLRELAEYLHKAQPETLRKELGMAAPPARPSPARAMTPTPKPGTATGAPRKFPSRLDIRREAVPPAVEGIAVVGMSGRYPQADNLREFWENLKSGKDCITEIPADRWDHSRHYDPDKKALGKTYTKWGGFLSGVDRFDPLFFNISPQEAEIMDPQERLFLQCVYEAVEDAGYTRQATGVRSLNGTGQEVGVYVGVMYEEYQLFGAQEQVSGNTIALSGSPASIANRVSYFFNFQGPSMAVDTMCSSSLTALHLACQSLRQGQCKMAIAGGVNISIHPNKFLMLAQGRFASSKGRCESFGEGGDGYVPGEGVGALILKPLKDALEAGDRIYGIIKGTSVNHGGKTNGYSVPNPASQAAAITAAWKDAAINSRSISYLEAHGTGTFLGDPIEIAGLERAFGPHTRDRQFCALGSVKSNIGHCESAAGMAGVTKVLLQMKHHQLVPTLHSATSNANIDFASSPFVLQQDLGEWKRPILEESGKRREYPRLAGVSSFGAGGSNAHIVLEEYVGPDAPATAEREWESGPALIVLSARKPAQLREQVRGLLDALASEELLDASVHDIAYTLQVGREAFAERLALAATDKADLAAKLAAVTEERPMPPDCHQGNTAEGKELVSVISSDEEFSGMLEKWLSQGKFSKVLELWVKGLEVDWRKLYAGPVPRRVGLRSYPFAGERYWVPKYFSADADGGPKPEWLHPLVHENVSDFSAQRYLSRFRGKEAFLPEVSLAGSRVFPPMAFPEMARTAVSLTCAADAGQTFIFSGMVWSKPASFGEEGVRFEINLAQSGDGNLDFEICDTGQGEEAARFRGKAIPAARETRKLDLAALESVCVESRQDAWGTRLGPGLALARVTTAEVAESRIEINPDCLETALRAVSEILAGWGFAVSPFPASLEELVLHAALPAIAVLHVRRSPKAQASDGCPRIDLDLCSEDGTVCARLEGLALAPRLAEAALTGDDVEPAPSETPDTGLSADERKAAAPLVVARLQALISKVAKIPAVELETAKPFEEFGLDSIIVSNIDLEIKEWLGRSDPTLFFKYNNLETLAGYFVEEYPAQVRMLLRGETVTTLATPTPTPVTGGASDAVGATGPVWTALKKTVSSKSTRHQAGVDEDIAIIGMSGRYPQATNLDEFWGNLVSGKDCIEEIPPDRWPLEGFYEADKAQAIRQGLSYSKWGGFLKDIECFDPAFFGISPREAVFMDPQERLFLEAAWHCVEDAGYTRSTLAANGRENRIGVFVGATFNNYQLVLADAARRLGLDMYVANSQMFSIANRVSYFMNFTGPSLAVDTACSSSLYAVHLACESIRRGDATLAIAGGVNLSLHPSKYITLCQTQFCATDGRCRAFAGDGTGYVPSEAVGAMLLKPLSSALRDRDSIHGVIKGTAASHSGKTNGYTVPNPASQSRTIESALKRSGIDPRSISLIEAHGTGTSLGDPIEIRGLQDVFRKYTQDRAYCAISSVKSNIGHSEAAAGMAQLSKVLLQMKHKTLVPNLIHGGHLNPAIDFERTPFKVQREVAAWEKPVIRGQSVPRRAGVSSFGAGGTNVHIILEEFDPGSLRGKHQEIPEPETGRPSVIVLSGKNRERVLAQSQSLLNAVSREGFADSQLPDMAHTLQVGREEMNARLALVVGNLEELREGLAGFIASDASAPSGTPGNGRIPVFYRDSKSPGADGGVDASRATDEVEGTAAAWAHGAKIDWTAREGGARRQKLFLPAYAFEKRRCWVDGIHANFGFREQAVKAAPTAIEPPPAAPQGGNQKQVVLEIIAEALGVNASELDPRQTLEESGIDSIIVFPMLQQFQSRIDPGFDLERLIGCRTIEDIVNAFPPEVTRIAPIRNAPKPGPGGLVRLNSAKSGRPVFWFHGGLGGVEGYAGIASASQRPFYGVHAGTDVGIAGIGAIVESYLGLIRSVQPHGPYDFGGYSLGGILAYEAAGRMQAMGERVDSLAMIDSPDGGSLGEFGFSPESVLLQSVNVSLLMGILRRRGGAAAFRTDRSRWLVRIAAFLYSRGLLPGPLANPGRAFPELIRNDALAPDQGVDGFRRGLLAIAAKAGVPLPAGQTHETAVDAMIAFRRSLQLERHSIRPLPAPQQVSAYYFRNRSRSFFGKFRPYMAMPGEAAGLEGNPFWAGWQEHLPGLRLIDVPSANHFTMLAEPDSLRSIQAVCRTIYAADEVQAAPLTRNWNGDAR